MTNTISYKVCYGCGNKLKVSQQIGANYSEYYCLTCRSYLTIYYNKFNMPKSFHFSFFRNDSTDIIRAYLEDDKWNINIQLSINNSVILHIDNDFEVAINTTIETYIMLLQNQHLI